MPAIERYTGVLYGELDWASLPRAARGRGADQVRIVSGLWGLVAPLDPIPHYKLKMSASLPDIGRLSTWWRPRLRSEEHTSELQSLMRISYAVFCLKKKKHTPLHHM